MGRRSTLFSFPDPVNETSARVVAGGVVTMATAAVTLDQPWLLVPLTYGFAARVAAGPTLSPLGRRRAAYGVLLVLIVAASLEAFLGVCLACRMFPFLVRAGIVPASACEECADIWARPEMAAKADS